MTTATGYAVIVRADGTVPFAHDLHPDHKRAIMGHLLEAGHEVVHEEGTGRVYIRNYDPSKFPPAV